MVRERRPQRDYHQMPFLKADLSWHRFPRTFPAHLPAVPGIFRCHGLCICYFFPLPLTIYPGYQRVRASLRGREAIGQILFDR